MKIHGAFILAAALALSLIDHQPANAQQSSDQQKCINALNKDFLKLAIAQGKEVCRCIKDRTKGGAVLIEDCMGSDPISAKVGRAKDRIVQDLADRCSGPATPDFGPSDAVAMSDAAVAKELDLVHDIFGDDVDTVIPQLSLTNRDQLRCQQAVAKAAKKCQGAKLKEFVKCKKAGLAEKTPPGAIVAPGQIETVCLMQSADPTTGQPDLRSKIAKACDPTVGKILSTIARKCENVGLSDAFPGCATSVESDLAACIDQHVECRVCRALNAADNLNRDCDLFDDATANFSCVTPADKCGPGDMWIGLPCGAGFDVIESSRAQLGIDTDLDCVADVSAVLFGDAIVTRSASLPVSLNFPAETGPGPDPDVIDTEIVSMSLVGGPVTLKAGAAAPLTQQSLGAIVQQAAPNSELADSFFDVFFEVGLSGSTFYNHTALRIEGDVLCVPPEVRYVHPTGCLPLFDDPTGGALVANLVLAAHNTNFCGNNIKGEQEQCDGTDDDACPGQCEPDCTCPDAPTKCGPGPHWIDTPCDAGPDLIQRSKAKFGIDLDLDCIADTSTYLFGDALIQRSESRDASANFPGPTDCDGSPCGVVDGHLDVIDTEIETMSLVRGPIALNAGAAASPLTPPSKGTIVENAGDPTLADSFFDIFFEVVISGDTMYNHVPFRVQSPVECVPPDTKYVHPTDCLPLYDDPIVGVQVANLVVAEHDTNFCGNNITGNQEECDGTDDAQCPGQCQVDCTCANPGKCGPASHWIDSPLCPGGTDAITDSRAQIGIDTDLDCVADVSTVLFGDALIQRSGAIDSSSHFPGATDCNGSPCGTVDSHLDVIDTEIVQLSLVSGPITVNAGTSATVAISPSLGTIVEQSANPALADSFFDVFFEILVNTDKLYNQSPFRLESDISCVPPEATYIHPIGCLALFDQPSGGTQVANLVLAQHNTNTCGNNRKGEDEECDGTDDAACPGNCQLDCTCPVACTGGVCGAFPSCNQVYPSCACHKTAEGGTVCADPFACASAVDCPGGSGDCPAGQICYVDTCCGVPKCGEASCTGAAPQSAGDAGGAGPTSTSK